MVKKRNRTKPHRHDRPIRDFYPKPPKVRYLCSLRDPVAENVPTTMHRRLVS